MTPKLYEFGDWIVEKLLSLRGKASNLLARLVVIAGVSMCAEPIWAPYLRSFAEKEFDLEVPDLGNPWLGVVLIIAGLTYHYLSTKADNGQIIFEKTENREHDRALLVRINSVLEPQMVREHLNWIANNDACFMDQRNELRDLAQYLAAPENEFLEPEVKDAADAYHRSIANLIVFMTQHFFVYPDEPRGPNNEFQICLYPDLNCDRRGSGDDDEVIRYMEWSDQLNDLVSEVSRRQVGFINKTKEKLKVA